MPAHKIGRLWKFKVSEVDEWVKKVDLQSSNYFQRGMNMGAIFKLSSLNRDEINKFLTPLVFCADEAKVLPYAKDYTALSINPVLSKRLLKYERDKYTMIQFAQVLIIMQEE